MNANRALRRICAALAIGASMLATVQAQELSFTLHEQLIIGDDEEAPSEYLFYWGFSYFGEGDQFRTHSG
ncbi:MAG: hypothetical protein F4221_06135 [Rhodothermaceae bacterium]|nr:hypothetical protein [Rhodothermaceae bacterium]